MHRLEGGEDGLEVDACSVREGGVFVKASLALGDVFGTEGADLGRSIWQNGKGEEAKENREDALENEDPAPAFKPGNTIHLDNSRREEAREGTRKSGGREEERNADLQLVALVKA